MLKYKLITFVKNLALQHLNEKNAIIFDDDRMLVSYPKSGNTWLRFLIANLITDREVNFATLNRYVPSLSVKNKELLKVARPRIIKSHWYFNASYKKVVYLVRDPRSVAVSYYYFLKRQNLLRGPQDFDSYFQKYLNGNLDAWGSWGENVGSWIGARNGDANFLLVKYEDLKKDTKSQLMLISNFLNLPYTQELIERAIANSSFEEMRKSEIAHGITKNDKKKPSNDEELYFVRKGEVDSYKNSLSQAQQEAIFDRWGNIMEKLGYKQFSL
jgi:hypothetical protein